MVREDKCAEKTAYVLIKLIYVKSFDTNIILYLEPNKNRLIHVLLFSHGCYNTIRSGSFLGSVVRTHTTPQLFCAPTVSKTEILIQIYQLIPPAGSTVVCSLRSEYSRTAIYWLNIKLLLCGFWQTLPFCLIFQVSCSASHDPRASPRSSVQRTAQSGWT